MEHSLDENTQQAWGPKGRPAPTVAVDGGGTSAQITPESDALEPSFGTREHSFVNLLLNELAKLSLRQPEDTVAENRINEAIAVIHGIQPRDEVEGMLAAQMFAAHKLAMEAAGRVNWGKPSPEMRDMHMKHATKLMAVFAKQIEALQRYRGKGRQKMVVEHVHVHSGGQAVVGQISADGGAGAGGAAPESEGTTP